MQSLFVKGLHLSNVYNVYPPTLLDYSPVSVPTNPVPHHHLKLGDDIIIILVIVFT
jgi:hypothetical protein